MSGYDVTNMSHDLLQPMVHIDDVTKIYALDPHTVVIIMYIFKLCLIYHNAMHFYPISRFPVSV